MTDTKINMSETIRKLSKEELEKLVNKSNSCVDILRKLNLSTKENNTTLLKKTILKHNLIPPKKRTSSDRSNLEDQMVENSTFCRGELKRRLLKEKLIENKCAICGLDPHWNNNVLVLQLDHINGINNDHRIENLRMLCYNCHSQTDTFTGKNNKTSRQCQCGNTFIGNFNKCEDCEKNGDERKIINAKKKKKCICGEFIYENAEMCRKCYGLSKQKLKLTKEELEKLLFEDKMSYNAIGRKYSVSGSTVRMRCLNLNIDITNKSYKSKNISDNDSDTESDSEINISKTIRNLKKVQLEELIKSSNSCADILRKLNFPSQGNKITLLKQTIEAHGLIPPRKNISNKGPKLDEILIENSSYARQSLIRRILRENIIKHKCALCNLDPIWNDNPLTLQIDHINGNNTDNRIDNLRFLCPNCHSQTDTFAGKKLKKYRKCECGSDIMGEYDKCEECAESSGSRKIVKNIKNSNVHVVNL
jgi:5-methylcytosine-specific restriction endonuclease McrA